MDLSISPSNCICASPSSPHPECESHGRHLVSKSSLRHIDSKRKQAGDFDWKDEQVIERNAVVTGAAGFIGSNLCDMLLADGWTVLGIDDLSTGDIANIAAIKERAILNSKSKFHFMKGDILHLELLDISNMFYGGEPIHLFHLAALGSVPRSIASPAFSLRVNVEGTINVLEIARLLKFKKVIFASSSSVYGLGPEIRVEHELGQVLSPYAASKRMCEILLESYKASYSMDYAALRFFNVYGPRQSPYSEYAAFIPKCIDSIIDGESLTLFNEGRNVRDFTYVGDVCRAMIHACSPINSGSVMNVGTGIPTATVSLYKLIRSILQSRGLAKHHEPVYASPRPGDVKVSVASTSYAEHVLGFRPLMSLSDGIEKTIAWHRSRGKI